MTIWILIMLTLWRGHVAFRGEGALTRTCIEHQRLKIAGKGLLQPNERDQAGAREGQRFLETTQIVKISAKS